jgi:hypothetical protein
MARKSSITIIDPRLKTAIDAAITEGRATIDDIVALVRGMGGEVSRSAVGRYKKSVEERLADFREKQAIAGEWVRQLKADPDGDIGQMLAQMLKVVAHNTQSDMLEEGADPKAISLMARALKDLTSVEEQKLAIEARAAAAATAAAAKSAAEAVDRVGKTLKLDEAVLKRIREEVYGITPTERGA